MKTTLAIMAALLGSSLWALAQQTTTKEPALPPLPPGLPADTAKAAPAKQLTDQEKAAAREAAEAGRLERLRRIKHAEKFLQSPLRTSDGKPATLEKLEAERAERGKALTEEFRRAHEQSEKEVDAWLNRHGDTLPEALRGKRPSAIRNGQPEFRTTLNERAAGLIKVSQIQPAGAAGLGLTGSNVFVGLWDEGVPQTNHAEFTYLTNRLLRLETSGGAALGSHATEMAGTITSAGIVAGSKGMAFKSTVGAYDWNDDFTEMSGQANTNALRLSNHSYGERTGWLMIGNQAYWEGDLSYSSAGPSFLEDHRFGAYRTYTYQQDTLAYSNPRYLIVRAAGNDRDDWTYSSSSTLYVVSNGVWTVLGGAPTLVADGDEGGFDTILPDATGKNTLTVGGTTAANSDQPLGMSAFGPTDDGRVKPDVVAIGEFLTTPTTGNSYAGGVGTSGASAATSGTLALLLEHWRNLFATGNDPWSATLKALIIHAADDASTFGPDFKTGWGVVNARQAADFLSANTNLHSLPHLKQFVLDQAGTVEFPLTVTATNELRVTIVWTDPSGTAYEALDRTNSVLVNDLDQRVISPSGSTNWPFAPNPDLTNQTEYARSQASGTGDNFRDNVEQVRLLSPSSGTYMVRVTHKRILQQPGVATNYAQQSFTLAASGNTPAAAPGLSLQTLMTTNGNVLLNWPSVPGRRYRAQYNDDLGTTNWSTYGDVVAAKTNVTLAVTSTNEARFFRLRIME